VDNTWPTQTRVCVCVCVCVSVISQFGVKFEVPTGTTDDDVTPCHLVGKYRRLEAAMEFPQYKNFVKIHRVSQQLLVTDRGTHRTHVEVHKRHFSDASLRTHPSEAALRVVDPAHAQRTPLAQAFRIGNGIAQVS